jgi:hypothetical protein
MLPGVRRPALAALALPLLLAARASAEKKVVRGAPICVDQAGKTVPCPTGVPVKPKPEPAPPVDGVEAAARLAVQLAAKPKPAPPPPAAPAHPLLFKLGLNAALTLGMLAVLLVLIKLKLRFAVADFEFEKEPRGPGEVARGFLKTKERPESVKAVLALYRDENDVPVRTLPADVGMPEQLLEGEGWRTPVSVTLPPDVHPPFPGGWALEIEGVIKGRKILAGDNPNLKPPA